MIPHPELLIPAVALLVAALLFLMKVYGRLDKFEETLAKRLEAKIRAGEQPTRFELSPPTLTIKPDVRHATHEDLRNVEIRVERLERQDTERLKLLTDGFAHLDEKNEDRSGKTHERINLLLTAVGELRGEVKRLPCSHGRTCT